MEEHRKNKARSANSSNVENANSTPATFSNNLVKAPTNNESNWSLNQQNDMNDMQSGQVISDMLTNNQPSRQQQANVTYRVNKFANYHDDLSLIDCGCNGGLAGNDMKQIAVSDFQKVYVTGIQDNKCSDLLVGTGAGKIMSTDGPLIGIVHQYAFYDSGKSIHAPVQLAAFGQTVDDTPKS